MKAEQEPGKEKKLPFFLFIRFFTVLLIIIFASSDLSAHVIPYDLKKLGNTGIALEYMRLGFTHILPLGFDHVLFITGLYLLNPGWKSILSQATAFTIAHSITLGLAMNGIISPPVSIVEPIIALSIMFVALENILSGGELKPWRIFIVFLFGLIHGLGFAGALAELGLPEGNFLSSLIMFNVGVELGQIMVVLMLYALV